MVMKPEAVLQTLNTPPSDMPNASMYISNVKGEVMSSGVIPGERPTESSSMRILSD